MKCATHRFSLDIHKTASQVSLSCRRGDTARKLYITLTEGGAPYKIAEKSYVVLSAEKPDHNVLFDHCAVENGVITYEFTDQTANAAGPMVCEIRVYGSDNQVLTSAFFFLIVTNTVVPGGVVESTGEFSALTKLITDANGLVDEVKEKLENGEFNGADGTSIFAVTDSEFAQIEEYRLFHTGDVYIITDGARRGNVYYADSPESAQLQGNICGKDGERGNQIHCYTTEEYQHDLPGYLIPGDVYIITEGDLRGNIYVATADDHSKLKGNISGADGKTPVKGVDYHTEVDKQEMVEAVLAALPDGDEVAY